MQGRPVVVWGGFIVGITISKLLGWVFHILNNSCFFC